MPSFADVPQTQRESSRETARLPFVDLFIGDTKISLGGYASATGHSSQVIVRPEQSPFMLVDFNYKLTSQPGVGNEVSITILDPNWDILEQHIARAIAQKQEIGFQFGWRGIDDKHGRNVTGLFIHNYTASYSPFEGARITLIAVDKTVQLTNGRRTKSFLATDNIGSVIKQVFELIDPSIEVQIDPIVNPVGEEHRCMQNMTPMEYIKELLKIAKSPKGVSKFNWVTEVGDTGKTIVKIRADNPGTVVNKQYIIGRQRMGEMLNFTPQILGSVLLTLGGGRADAVSVNPETGAVQRVSSTQDEVGPVHGDKSVHKTPSIPTAIHELPYTILDAVKGIASEFRARADDQMNNATALVLGDPTIKPYDQIDVIVLKSDVPGTVGELSDKDISHTSGVYRVFTAEHTIQAGMFRTTLELYRESSFIGTKANTLRLPAYLRPNKNDVVRFLPSIITKLFG